MDIKQLKPEKLWEYFYEISQIPRVSHNMKPISDYLMNEFKKLGYEPIVDAAFNVFVKKPATVGLEKLPSVLLQGHSDMVGAKDPSSNHDFAKDPIATIVDNGWVHANKTTLGADNGIAVAIILSIFADKTLKHGPLEALITSDEETGMEGIQKFDTSLITSKYMINLDNEDDKEICIGCPGNIDVEALLPYQRETNQRVNSTNLQIEISGCLGGHSGGVIGEKRINAIKEMFDILNFINEKFDIRLIDIEKSGIVKNIIPFQCAANINVLNSDIDGVKKIIVEEFSKIKAEYTFEKELKITCGASSTKILPINKIDTCKIIGIYSAVPNAVWTFNWQYNVPETSSNLGLIETKPNGIWSLYMVRSSYDQSQHRLSNRIIALFKSVGGEAKKVAFVSGWLPKPNALADVYAKFYKQIFNQEAKQVLINGGVEPAFVLSKKPEMIGISVGPLMKDIHSKNEMVNIESTQKFFDVLCKFLPTIN